MSKTRKNSKDFTEYEKTLIRGFSNTQTRKTSLIFVTSAFLTSAIPFLVTNRLFLVAFHENLNFFALTTTTSTYMLFWAYSNKAFKTKIKMIKKSKQTNSKRKGGKPFNPEDETRIFEAVTWSLFFNNTLFLASIFILIFGVFCEMAPMANYALSVVVSTSMVVLLSSL